jgi:large subunit ribosomal protein L25
MATQKDTLKLIVQTRQTTGRLVKKLRRQNIIPANVYGKDIKSQSVQVDLKQFLPAWNEAGETGVIYLTIDKDTQTRPVMIHNVQLNPLTDQPLHVDFHQVNLKEVITAMVPVEVIGESPAVTQHIGVLIQPVSEIEVEALPTEIPEKFEIDISSLSEIDQAVAVSSLKSPSGVKILTDPTAVLAKIEPPAKEEVAPAPAPAEGEAAVPAEGEAATTEGDTAPTEETKPAESVKPTE